MSVEEAKSIFEPEMPEVPEDWAVKPFLDVVSVVSDKGKRTKQRDYLVEGGIPVIDQGQGFIGGYINDVDMAFEGELPIIVFGDHTRAIKYVNQPFAVGADGVKLLKPDECFDTKFFYYLLNSLQIPSRGYSRHFQFLKKFHLPIAPLEQQKRIVAEIEKQFSRLDEAVANLKRVKANLIRYKAAVLKAAVEGKLTEEWRKQHSDVEPADKLLERILAERREKWTGKGKYKEPVAPDTSGLPELPEGWVWANFEIVSDRVTVGHVGSMKNEYVEEGVPFLRSQNVRANRFDPKGLKYISEEFHERLGKSALNPGDIVVVRSGSVGVSCVIPEDLCQANCSDLVIIKSPRAVLSAFGAYYMNSVVETRVAAGKVGVALTHFNTKSVAELPIPVAPLVEQHAIVAEVERCLSIVAGAEAQVDANLRRADRLRQSILKQAFSGQLVPQDPNDETASVLLERMRAQQTTFVKAAKENPALRRRTKSIAKAGLEPVTPAYASLDSILYAILRLMQTGKEYSRAEIVDVLGLSSSRWSVAIQELKRRGKVRQVGKRSGARYSLG